MTHLVVGNQALFLAVEQRRQLHPHRYPVDRIVNFLAFDRTLAPPRRQNCRLVEQVGQFCAGKSGGTLGDRLQRHLGSQLLITGMDFQDRKAAIVAGQIHRHLAIEASRTQQCRIQNIWAVGGGDDDHPRVALEAVHFGEQLVQGLFALIVPAADARTALATHGVNLVNKDNAGGIFLGFFE